MTKPIDYGKSKVKAAGFVGPVEAANGSIATTKLAASADLAALTAARATPAANSTTGSDIAAVLVALGVMQGA